MNKLRKGLQGMIQENGDYPFKLKALPGTVLAGLASAFLLAGCATVKVEAPDKPIEINLNVKITQELYIKLDKEIDALISSNPDIF